jgi:hypothetical protein
MNAGLTLAMIISMLLAMGVSGNPDAAKKKQQEEASQFLVYRAGGQCSLLVCGSNHNETLISENDNK